MACKGALALDQETLRVLSTGVIDGSVFRITAGQLDRKLYEAVNDVLTRLGGKWDRRAKGHVFAVDPSDALDTVIITGEVGPSNPHDFFETPDSVADRMAALAGISNSCMQVLEPSAGEGAIIRAMRRAGFIETVVAVEIDEERARRLATMPRVAVAGADFMRYVPVLAFDRILMNPPFSRGREVAHITHAHQLLAAGGRLVSVASAGVTFREDRPYRELRDLVAAHGYIEPLPAGSFKASGTDVGTVLVVMEAAG